MMYTWKRFDGLIGLLATVSIRKRLCMSVTHEHCGCIHSYKCRPQIVSESAIWRGVSSKGVIPKRRVFTSDARDLARSCSAPKDSF